jgi:hypothetical protein
VLGEALEEEDRAHAGLAEVGEAEGVHRVQAAGLELHLQQDRRVERLPSLEARADDYARTAYAGVVEAVLFADGEVIAVGMVEPNEIVNDIAHSPTLYHIIASPNQIHVARCYLTWRAVFKFYLKDIERSIVNLNFGFVYRNPHRNQHSEIDFAWVHALSNSVSALSKWCSLRARSEAWISFFEAALIRPMLPEPKIIIFCNQDCKKKIHYLRKGNTILPLVRSLADSVAEASMHSTVEDIAANVLLVLATATSKRKTIFLLTILFCFVEISFTRTD